MRFEGHRERDERLGRRVDVATQRTLADREVRDADEVVIQRDGVRARGSATGGDAQDRRTLVPHLARDCRVGVDDEQVHRPPLGAGRDDLELRREDRLGPLAAGLLAQGDDRGGSPGANGLGGLRQPWTAHAPRLAEDGVDAREQLGGMEGLRQVVRRAAGQPAHFVEDIAARRKEDHRDVRGGAVALHLEAHVVAVGVGQPDVEQHEVRVGFTDEREAVSPGATDRYGHAVRLQAALEHVGRCRVVLDDHNARFGLHDGHDLASPRR